MAITKRQICYLHCDVCREQFIGTNKDGSSDGQWDMLQKAIDMGWYVLGSIHYCPRCRQLYFGTLRGVTE
jgi:hypothetical protein